MLTYIGTKTVIAKPMNRQDYNDYRGWALPEDENGTDDGYLVEYVDGGKPNHQDHSGYISWSPKEVFDNSYKVAQTPLDRLVIESEELDERIEKLAAFLNNDITVSLLVSSEQARLLKQQLSCMNSLSSVLRERMALMLMGSVE